MPVEQHLSKVRCLTALGALLLVGTACASRTRNADQAPATQPAATQPASPAVQGEKPSDPAAAPATAPAAATPGIPADHVKDKDGVMHKPGYKRPSGDCTSCHGKDLRGDGKAPSCYKCHGQEWH